MLKRVVILLFGIGLSWPVLAQNTTNLPWWTSPVAGDLGLSSEQTQKIREIVESGTTQLRHPVGPDAEPFLGWRASLNDEAWVHWGAQSDADWLKAVKADFGMDLKFD